MPGVRRRAPIATGDDGRGASRCRHRRAFQRLGEQVAIRAARYARGPAISYRPRRQRDDATLATTPESGESRVVGPLEFDWPQGCSNGKSKETLCGDAPVWRALRSSEAARSAAGLGGAPRLDQCAGGRRPGAPCRSAREQRRSSSYSGWRSEDEITSVSGPTRGPNPGSSPPRGSYVGVCASVRWDGLSPLSEASRCPSPLSAFSTLMRHLGSNVALRR